MSTRQLDNNSIKLFINISLKTLKYLTSVFLNRVNLSIDIIICSLVNGLTFEFFNDTLILIFINNK